MATRGSTVRQITRGRSRGRSRTLNKMGVPKKSRSTRGFSKPKAKITIPKQKKSKIRKRWK